MLDNPSTSQPQGSSPPPPRWFGDYALELFQRDYPVIPIRPRSKIPALPGWQHAANGQSERAVRELVQEYPDYGLGIVCGRVVAVDIDIQDHGAAKALATLAQKKLGLALMRVGRAPKLLLLYRAEQPLSKLSSRWFAYGGQRHRIEVLAHGQQFVALADHPETGQPYRWSVKSPRNTGVADLTEVSGSQLREFIPEAEALLLQFGFEAVEAVGGVTTVVNPLDPPSNVVLLPTTMPSVLAGRESTLNDAAQANMPSRRFEDLPTHIQNHWLRALIAHPDFTILADAGYEVWRNLVFAFADAEQRGATEARQIAEEWSRQSPKWDQRAFDNCFRVRSSGNE